MGKRRSEREKAQDKLQEGKQKVAAIKGVATIIRCILIIAVLAVIIVVIVKVKGDTGKELFENAEAVIVGEEGKVVTVTESTLQQVVRNTKLYTAEFPYNGYLTVFDDDDKVKYHVAYEGTIKAGIDVTKVQVSLPEGSDSIVIRLPEVELEKPIVDAGTLEFIFEKKKYDTPDVPATAYELAIKDLENKASQDETIKKMATDNAKLAMRAMVEPWVEQTSEDVHYRIKVVAYDE